MSSFGSVPLVNTENRTALLVLASSQAKNADSTLSQCSFAMVDGLAVKDDNYTALVSVKSFVFTNSIPNIPRNGNILKFLSVWYNAAAAAYQSNIMQVNIPVGNVTSTSLLNYLNGFNNGTGNGLI